MCWVRGNPMDYELWEALGADGWRWSNVLPYFQRLEAVQGGGPLRGTDGAVKVTRGREADPFYHAFVQAGAQAGYAQSPNMNQRQHEGFGPIEKNVGGGKRCSAAVAYLRPAMARGNVRVVTGALVDRIEFTGRRATAVLFAINGQACRAQAGLEVILSAGSIMSPTILKRSGMGLAPELHGWLLLSPALIIGVVFFGVPALFMARMSVNTHTQQSYFTPGFTLENYARLASDPLIAGAIWNTVWLALIGSVVTIVLAYGFALIVWLKPVRWRLWFIGLAFLPLLISEIAIIFGWWMVFPRNGLLSIALVSSGLITDQISLMDTEGAALIGLVYITLPYCFFILLSVLTGWIAGSWMPHPIWARRR